MKQIHYLVLALVLLSMTPCVAQEASWSRTNGPYGARVNAIVAVNGTLFASTGSLYRSTNGGADWQSVGPFHVPRNAYEDTKYVVRALAADSTGAVFVSTMLVLYRSTDNGETWRAVAGSNQSLSNTAVAVAVGVDNTAYFIMYGALYRRAPNDSAATYLGFGNNGPPVTTIAIAPGGSVFATVGASTVYRSDDNGVSWATVNTGADTSVPAILNLTALTRNRLFAGTAQGPIWSYDGGATWQRDTSSLRERIVTSAVLHDGLLYAGTELFGAFRSSDLGATWTEVTPGLDDPNVWALTVGYDGSILAGTSSGIERSSDAGASWNRMVLGISASIVDIAIDRHGHVFAATTMGVFRTLDDGGEWVRVNRGLTERDVSDIAVDSSGSIVAITRGGVLFRSSDEGGNWSRVGAITGYDPARALTACASGTLLAAARAQWPAQGKHILRSTDGGSTWSVVYAAADVIGMTITADGSIIAISTDAGTYRSTSDGASWSRVSIVDQPMNAIASDRNGNVYASSGWNMWRSSDNGSTWTGNYVGQYFMMASLTTTRGGALVAGVLHTTMHASASTDRGLSWQDVSTGLDTLVPTSLATSPNGIVFGGTVEGVVRSTSAVTSAPLELAADQSVQLSPVQPNPVRGSATMRFAITSTSRVVLSLYDMRGNEVATLYDGIASGGTHDVTIDARVLSPGVYACRLQAGSHVVVERVIVE